MEVFVNTTFGDGEIEPVYYGDLLAGESADVRCDLSGKEGRIEAKLGGVVLGWDGREEFFPADKDGAVRIFV